MTRDRPLVYLAGAIEGRSYQEAVAWRQDAAQRLSGYGIVALDPLRGKPVEWNDATDVVTVLDTPMTQPLAITTRDRSDVRRCNVMLAHFDNGPHSVGTLIELGWADVWRKPVVALVAAGNPIRRHPMVQSIVGFWAADLDQAVAIVASVIGSGVEVREALQCG